MANIVVQESDGVVKITLPGKFNYELIGEFRTVFKSYPTQTQYEINFAHVMSIDSSALGILLLLLDRNAGSKEDIVFVNCSVNVMKVFRISNFHTIFTIK